MFFLKCKNILPNFMCYNDKLKKFYWNQNSNKIQVRNLQKKSSDEVPWGSLVLFAQSSSSS